MYQLSNENICDVKSVIQELLYFLDTYLARTRRETDMTENDVKIVYHSVLMNILSTLSRKFREDEWPKLKQAAEVHGYRGPSRRKHNGIVPIRPTDKGLLKTLQKTTQNLISPDDRPGLMPVKAVAHVPSGNRLVGYMDNRVGQIVFYAVANYND